jgi:hypothetical protein
MQEAAEDLFMEPERAVLVVLEAAEMAQSQAWEELEPQILAEEAGAAAQVGPLFSTAETEVLVL